MLGVCSASAEVQVSLSGTQNLGPLTPDADGHFEFANVPLRKNSVNTFTVNATDDAGNVATREINITQVSLENVVVSQVTTNRLSQQEIEQLVSDGVIDLDDPSNYNVSRFQIVLTIGTEPVAIDVPIAIEKEEVSGYEVYKFPRGDNGGSYPRNQPPTEIVVFEQMIEAGPGLPQPPPIPGVIIIEGNIRSLKEFFSVRLLLMNASGIFTLQDVTARISYPDEGLSSILPADGIAAFGEILPGDEAQPGQAEREFIVRGDEIGTRRVRIDFGGFVAGLGIPDGQEIPFNGAAIAELEVLGPPNFLVQVQHPDEVLKNEPYQLTIDITNVGELPALYASLELDVGADADIIDIVVDPVTGEPASMPVTGAVVRNLGHIEPGETTRQVFTINPLRTGPISSCFGISDQNITLEVAVGSIGCLTGQRPASSALAENAPTVSVVPSANALGVGIDSPVVAFFSRVMDEDSITQGASGSFRVIDEDDNVPPGEFRFEEMLGGTVAIWQLKDDVTNRLSPDTEYRVIITQDVLDVDGVPLASEWYSTFTTTNPTADTDPPTATLTVLPPVDPNYVLPGEIVRLNAYAADQGTGVGRIELRVRDMSVDGSEFEFIDQKTVFDGTIFPLIFAIESAKLTPGHTYQYKLTAYDRLANSQDATIAIIVAANADPPTIVLPVDPAANIVKGISVPLTPLSFSQGVKDVYYFLDDNIAAFARITLAPYQTVVPTLALALGPHTIRAVAVDGLNQIGYDTFAFTIAENTGKPIARILGASDGTQFPRGVTITVSADVQDDVGIAYVGYHLDDAGGGVFASGFGAVSLNTSSLALGAHRIIVHAINKLGTSSDLTDPGAILEFVVVEPPPGQAPAAPAINSVSVPEDGKVTVRGTSVPGAQITIANLTRGISIQVVADSSGHFRGVIDADGGDQLGITALDLTQSPDSSAMSTITVPVSATLDHIEVSPGTLLFTEAGGSANLAVTAHYSDSSTADVTTRATFTSSASAVASVGSAGQVVAQGNGSATITATFEGFQAQATVHVNIVMLESISVDPTSIAFLAVSETRQLIVTGHYSDGSTLTLGSASFATGNPSVAKVSSAGLVTAVGDGSTTTIVSVGKVQPVTVSITVDTADDTPPGVEILSPGTGAEVERGQEVTVVVKATDGLGGVKRIQFNATGGTVAAETRLVSPPALSTQQSFALLVADNAPIGGSITVAVVATDTNDSQSEPASIVLTVADKTAPSVSISEPVPGALLNYGDTVTVTVNATDAVGVVELGYSTSGAFSVSSSKAISSPVSPASATFTFKVPFNCPRPELAIEAFAKDAMGNEGQSAPVNILVTDADITPPETEVTTVSSPGSASTCTVAYEVISGLDDLDHVELYFRRNGIGTFNRYTDASGGNPLGEFVPQSGSEGTMVFDCTKMGGDGHYEFYSVGVDRAGNREAAPEIGGVPVGDDDAICTFATGADVVVLTSSAEISADTFDNQNLRIVGATITLVGHHDFQNVELLNGATLTHRAATLSEEPSLDVSAWTLTIDASSAVNVDGLGYLGGRQGANSAHDEGRTLNNALGSTLRSGGSYGGPGATLEGTPNALYGDLTNPCELGSGGSAGGYYYAGGSGGGRVALQAINVVCDGAISANGGKGSGYGAGSGSGGALRVVTSTLSGNGSVRANGSAHEVGGGGGRVAVYCVDMATMESSRIRALGGNGGTAAGGSGTVFLKQFDEDNGTLVFDGQSAGLPYTYLPIPAGYTFDTIVIRNSARVVVDQPLVARESVEVLNGSTLTHSAGLEAGLSITAPRVYVDATSAIDVTGKGYAGGRTAGNDDYNEGRTLGNLFGARFQSGGTYGGYGGVASGDGTNLPYGHPAQPVYLGSGGSCGGYYYDGGNGGGRVTINASYEVQVEGSILANGNNGTGYQGGSGSGGSVLINTLLLRGSGTIAADGGALEVGGGGGRVAVYYDSLGVSGDDFSATRNIHAFGGHGNSVSASAGTVFLKSGNQSRGDLYIDDNMSGATAANWTTLTPLGLGKIASITEDTLTTDTGRTMMPDGLVGIEINPNLDQDRNFVITSNTETSVTVDVSSGVRLTDVAQAGDAVGAVYTFDNVYLRRGGYLVLGDPLTVDALLLIDEHGRLDHFAATTTFEPRLDLNVGTLWVTADSTIDASARGYLGGQSGSNSGNPQGRTLANALGSTFRSGGSFGGLGGAIEGAPNAVYGNLTDPACLGSGGSAGGYDYRGGSGGGCLLIRANDVILDGLIAMDGTKGSGYSAGSGSGGTINIQAVSLSGSGEIRASGGASEVGGGGGRIAVVYDTLDFDPAHLKVFGGMGNQRQGGNGTIFLRQRSEALGDLVVDGSGGNTPSDSTPLPSGLEFENLTLRNNARVVASEPVVVHNELQILSGSMLTHPARSETGLLVAARSMTLDSTSSIDVTGRGYAGGRTAGNEDYDEGRTLGNELGARYRSGGSYGGAGGVSDGAGSNPAYGHPAQPDYLGSGGSAGGFSYDGGQGGGRVRLDVAEDLTIDGFISANGTNGTGYQSGSGSGGSVEIHALTFEGSGEIEADGGAHEVGGGGGRIAVFYDTWGASGNDFNELRSVHAFGGHGSRASGSAGTVLWVQTGQEYGDLYIDDNMSGSTGPNTTPLTVVGPGEIAALTENTLVTDANVAMVPDGLAGLELNPNLDQDVTFVIVANTTNTITVQLPDTTTLTDVAAVGDTYAAVYRFDNITLRRGGSLILAEPLRVGGAMTVSDYALLTHYDVTLSYEPCLDIVAHEFELDSTSSIVVDGRGYLGGRAGGNASYNEGRTTGNALGSTFRSGGSYGGLGAALDGTPNPLYGSAADPADFGSGGSCGSYYYPGGDGGGWVSIKADAAILDGLISANGLKGNGYQAGSGSGGAVNISAPSLSGAGTINANGGGNEVGGGGGRIALSYVAGQSDIASLQIAAEGGTGNHVSGQAGSIQTTPKSESEFLSVRQLLSGGSSSGEDGEVSPTSTDSTPPTVSIIGPSSAGSKTSRVTYQVNYSGADTITLSAGDVILHATGTATAQVSVSGSGTLTRTVKLTQVSGAGTLAISIADGTACDAAGNQAPAVGPSAAYAVSALVAAASAPTGVSATDGTYIDHIRVSWDSVDVSGTEYCVYRDGAAVCDWQTSTVYDDYGAQVAVTASTGGCSSGKSSSVYHHTYAVLARNSLGESSLSASDTGYCGASKSLDAWTEFYEEALPAPAATPESVLALRLISDEPIDPASVWAVAEGDGWSEQGGAWRATTPGDNSDGWVLFASQRLLPAEREVTLTVGAKTESGVTVGPVSHQYWVEPLANADEHAGLFYVAEEAEATAAIPSVAGAASPLYRVGPSRVFEDAATVRVVLPLESQPENLELYYYSEAPEHRGWYRADNVLGWMVPGTRRIVEEDGRQYLEFRANHSALVQLVDPIEAAAATADSGILAGIVGVASVIRLLKSLRKSRFIAGGGKVQHLLGGKVRLRV